MNQNEKAKRFAELHVKGAPLLLYNAWDAGSAKSILEAGAPAIATSSWSVAEDKGIETARPSRSNSPSRSSGGSQRPSISPSLSISKGDIARTTANWRIISPVFSDWA